MSRTGALMTAVTAVAMVCAGCGAGAAGPPAPASRTAASPPTARPSGPAAPAGGSRRWPARVILRDGLASSAMVADPAAGVAFALVSGPRGSGPGTFRLERISLATGSVRRGASFGAGNLGLAGGYLWVSGPATPGSATILSEVSPVSLAGLRSWTLPGGPRGAVPVAAGPAGSVWAGTPRGLIRLDTFTGAVLSRVPLPAGLIPWDLSADPAGRHLYVSAAHLAGGGAAGAVMLEYDDATGHLLARASGAPFSYSAAGGEVTAVPGGVWVSLRTGMLGLTTVLRQRDLAVVAPRHPRAVASGPAGTVFHWPMGATTVYGGGTLWLANQAGIVACLDPLTGRTLAAERVGQPGLIYLLLAADPAAHLLYGTGPGGLMRISPPGRCWA